MRANVPHRRDRLRLTDGSGFRSSAAADRRPCVRGARRPRYASEDQVPRATPKPQPGSRDDVTDAALPSSLARTSERPVIVGTPSPRELTHRLLRTTWEPL